MKLGYGSFVLAATLIFAPASLAQDQGTPPAPQPGGEAQPPPPPPGAEEGGRRREGRGGRGMGGMGLPVDRLKEELGLTDDQVKQIETMNQELREKGRELMRDMFGGGGGDPQAGREKIRALFEETWTKLDGLLTPEQKEKAQAVRKQMEERMQGRFMGGGGRGGEGFGPGGRGNTRQRLREDALKALALTEDEAAVVTPLLDTCLETRELLMREGETRRQAFLEKARQTTDAAALTKALEEFRAAREADKATATQAMSQLREVLTVEQEAKLVGLGILD